MTSNAEDIILIKKNNMIEYQHKLKKKIYNYLGSINNCNENLYYCVLTSIVFLY